MAIWTSYPSMPAKPWQDLFAHYLETNRKSVV